jgi:biopolymer transport protein ExbB/TolQ
MNDTTFWDLFRQGGFMMWVMLAVSMFALSLMIESAVKWRENVVVPPYLFDQLRALIRRGEYEEAWRVGEVLVATVFGLFLAVPAFFAYYFFGSSTISVDPVLARAQSLMNIPLQRTDPA